MTRVDVPTLRCDRCGFTTQDLSEMAKFQELMHYSQAPTASKWDLCAACWIQFNRSFIGGSNG